jgi:phosphatidyl-myo-inositol dimannoside synthase
MRILLLAGSYPPETGGIAEYMRAFAEGLKARGVEVEIIANPKLPPRGYLKRVEACRAEVVQRVRARSFDRIVASSWSPYAVASPLPFDVFCHGMDLLEPSHSWRYRLLMKRTLQQASRILANSRYTADLAITAGAPARNVVVLHPGVDGERFKPPTGARSGKVILSMGRLVERKGFDTVLRALPEVIKTVPDVRYVCAGDGPDRDRLRNLAAQLKITAHVDWPGEITGDERMALYQSADVFVMPNRIVDSEGSVEGFGIVFLEAAACELPVIAGNTGGAPDAVVHDVTGLLVAPTDVAGLAKEISRLLASPELRIRMGKQARERALESFREEQIAERYLAALG